METACHHSCSPLCLELRALPLEAPVLGSPRPRTEASVEVLPFMGSDSMHLCSFLGLSSLVLNRLFQQCMALSQLGNLQGLGWFFLRLEQGIVLGLVVIGTCLYPGAWTNISPSLPSSPLCQSPSLPFIQGSQSWVGLTVSTVAEPPLHLEWPFPNSHILRYWYIKTSVSKI